MRLSIVSLLIILGLLTTVALVTPPAAQAAKTTEKGQVFLDFKDIPLPDLIRTISELTGKNFLYDDRIKGTATIISPSPMSLEEAYQLFLATLNVKGYSVVTAGKTHKIIPSKQAEQSNVPTLSYNGLATDQLVTRLVHLKYVDSVDLTNSVLGKLVPKTTRIVPYPPLNRLIISDRASNIKQIVRLIRRLDVADNQQQTILVPLQNASADTVATIIQEMLSQTAAPASRAGGGGAAALALGQPATVLAYSRTNTLVAKGSAQQVKTVQDIARQLDADALTQRSPLNVYYLEHADAETLAKTLNEIVSALQQNGAVSRQEAGNQQATDKVTITADKPTNALIISAAAEDLETINGIIEKLDVERKQVFVEALILELSMEATEQLGVSLQGAAEVGGGVISVSANQNTGNVGLGDFTPVSDDSTIPGALTQAVSGILAGGLFSPIETTGADGQTITVPALSVLIDISRRNADINILSAPRLLTSDNEEAEIVVGSEVPIITSRLTDTGGSGDLAQSVTVERKDVALTLRLTPQITEGEQVRLNVFQEITDLATTAVGNVDEVGPTLTKRLVRNTVVAEDGRTVVLGGLIQSNVQETVNKVPLLGDLPVLGWLFKTEGLEERKTNLLVFITPTIIRDAKQLSDISGRARSSMHAFKRGDLETFSEPEVDLDLKELFPTVGGTE